MTSFQTLDQRLHDQLPDLSESKFYSRRTSSRISYFFSNSEILPSSFFSLIFIYLLLLYCFLKYLFEEIGLGYLWWLYICLSAMPNMESQSFGRYK